MNAAFELHARLAADTRTVGDFALCRLLLMNDSRYPWCILVPRRNGLREIHELGDEEQARFWRESSALGRALMQEFAGEKLNVAALGNVVPQLHVHHIVRHSHDDAWPAPVWGRHPALPYEAAALEQRVARLQQLLQSAGLSPA